MLAALIVTGMALTMTALPCMLIHGGLLLTCFR